MTTKYLFFGEKSKLFLRLARSFGRISPSQNANSNIFAFVLSPQSYRFQPPMNFPIKHFLSFLYISLHSERGKLKLTLHSAFLSLSLSQKLHQRVHKRENFGGYFTREGYFPSSRNFTSRITSTLTSFKPKTDGKIMTEANIQLDEVDSPGTTFSVVLAFAV